MAQRALLCGINDYHSVRDLRGCLQDVQNMKALLTSVFGFRQSDVRTLQDNEVTKKTLRKEFSRLVEGTGPGDVVVFHFSGHGSFVRDQDGDEEDNADEIFCLYDMDFARPTTFLLDDELGKWIADVPTGANLIIVTDCCHSGTNTREVRIERNGKTSTFALDTRTTNRLAAAGEVAPEQADVIARFLPPPNYSPSRDPGLLKKLFEKLTIVL